MPLYLIKIRHAFGNCLGALDEQVAYNVRSLQEFVYACGEGEHAGYAIVEANSRSEAMNILPESLRREATVWKVDRFTPDDIKSFHTKAA